MIIFQFKLVRLIASLALGSVVVAGCLPGANFPGTGNSAGTNNNNDTKINCDKIPTKNISTAENNSVLNIEIHVDGSGSMLGYVAVPNSRYSKTLEAVDQTFSLTSNTSTQPVKVSYFRTGYSKDTAESLQALDRSLFQKSREAEFYTGIDNPRFRPISSQVSKAIESLGESENKLIVLVSDIGQDDGDVTSILQTIRSNVFLSKDNKRTDNALAIVGIKSEFNGKVYSPTNPSQSYPYSTLEKSPESYRPFYLLIMGSSSDVKYFLGQLEISLKSLIPDIFEVSNPSNSDQNQKTIEASLFYPNLLPVLTFQNALVESEKEKEIREVYALRNRDLALRFSSLSTSKALVINTSQPVSQNYQISLSNSSDSQDKKLENLVSPVSLDTESSLQAFDSSTGTFVEKPENSPITVSNLNYKSLNPLELSFDLKINPVDLVTSSIYLYQIRFRAKELAQHNWWTEWNASQEQNPEHGNKTYKLFNFLTGLSSLTSGFMETGELCYAIQRK